MERFIPQQSVFLNSSVVISSVGFNAQTTAASMRAGINRPEPLDGFAEQTEDGEEDIIGYPIRLLTHGFQGAGRYIQLLSNGFKALEAELNNGAMQSPEIYLMMCVPELDRYMQTQDQDSPLEENPFQFYNQGWDETIHIALSKTGTANLVRGYKVIPTRPSACADLYIQAAQVLREKPQAAVVLGFVDSHTDEAALSWLNNTARLKTANNPVGMMPGEAVSFSILSNQSTQGALSLLAVNKAKEEHTVLDEPPPEGRGLCDLLMDYNAQNPPTTPGEFWCIANLTGEEKPSMEWGRALHLFRQNTSTNPNPNMWLPNVSLGEVGICYPSIALAWAQQSIQRHYAPASTCAITTHCYSNDRTLMSVRGA